MAKEKRKPGDELKRGYGDPAPKNLMLSLEARERLGLFALQSGESEGVIVDWLICTNPQLRRYVVSDRGVEVVPSPAPDLGGGADDPAPTLPISEAVTPAPPDSPLPAPGQGRGQARGRQRAG